MFIEIPNVGENQSNGFLTSVLNRVNMLFQRENFFYNEYFNFSLLHINIANISFKFLVQSRNSQKFPNNDIYIERCIDQLSSIILNYWIGPFLCYRCYHIAQTLCGYFGQIGINISCYLSNLQIIFVISGRMTWGWKDNSCLRSNISHKIDLWLNFD